MIFSGYEQMGERPFGTVLFHGLVRDEKGRKMSKSLGNGIDPLEVIEKYGADALRFTLITGNAPGNDMRFSYERIEASRNFANKIWNASRFVLMNLEGKTITDPSEKDLGSADRWILSRMNETVREVTENMEKYELGIAAGKIYDFIWDEYCDWYIEMVKPRLRSDDEAAGNAARFTLKTVLITALKLLHPYMPFVTEEIFCIIREATKDDSLCESIMISDFPVYDEKFEYRKEEKEVALVKEAVKGIRNVRSSMNVAPSRKADVTVVSESEEVLGAFKDSEDFFKVLASAAKAAYQKDKTGIPDDAVSVVVPNAVLYMPFAELVDISEEKARLEKEVKRLEGELKRSDSMLSNEKFLNKAPAAKIEEEKEKRGNYEKMLKEVKERLELIK
ncbi:MAG: class I tRNA ligase family protein, partial [Lachnospiraceae bacterium]|nr:class I tRNA ligase family protein [Lachnospiraceae bacterium]